MSVGDRFPTQIFWFQRICASHCKVEEESVELRIRCFPVTCHTEKWKATVLIISPPYRSQIEILLFPRGRGLLQPPQADLPISWPPVSHCTAELGMHSVLHWFLVVLCAYIFAAQPKGWKHGSCYPDRIKDNVSHVARSQSIVLLFQSCADSQMQGPPFHLQLLLWSWASHFPFFGLQFPHL